MTAEVDRDSSSSSVKFINSRSFVFKKVLIYDFKVLLMNVSGKQLS